MPLHYNLGLPCENSFQLGVSLVLKHSSKAIVELLENYNNNKPYNLQSIENSTQWTHPVIYHGIQGKHKRDVQHKFSSIVSSFNQFNVELTPCYEISFGKTRGFQIGFEFRHDILEEMKLAFSRWGGEGFPYADVHRPFQKFRSASCLFYPVQMIHTEDETEAQSAITELADLLRKPGNIFTVDSLLLHEFWTDVDGKLNNFSTLAAFPLVPSKDRVLAELAKMRLSALKEEVVQNQKRKIASTCHPETPAIQVLSRKVMSFLKHDYLERLRRPSTETEFNPGLAQNLKSKKCVHYSSLHSVDEVSIPALEKKNTIFKDVRYVLRTPTNLRNLDLEVALDDCLSNSSFLSCTRLEAQRLEMEKSNRPLVRYEKSGQLIKYIYHTYDLPLMKYKCHIHHPLR